MLHSENRLIGHIMRHFAQEERGNQPQSAERYDGEENDPIYEVDVVSMTGAVTLQFFFFCTSFPPYVPVRLSGGGTIGVESGLDHTSVAVGCGEEAALALCGYDFDDGHGLLRGCAGVGGGASYGRGNVGGLSCVENGVEDRYSDCAADGADCVQEPESYAHFLLRNAVLCGDEGELCRAAETCAGDDGDA